MGKAFSDELMKRYTARTGNLGGAITAHEVADMIADAVELTMVRQAPPNPAISDEAKAEFKKIVDALERP